jgi:carboxyl-terminal processing protease
MRTHSAVAVVLAVALSALAGGVFGTSALATQDRVPQHYKAFTTALAVIESQYAEKVESDRLVYGAINGMLQTLDPHSSFMDPKSYAQMRERQEGRYYGLGVTIQAPAGDITAVRVFEGSPAHDKGIRRGDVIAEIEGESTKGWTTEDAVAKLRGPKDTFVNIGIRRKGLDALIPMAVNRDQVSIPSLSAVFMIDDQTGYVGITDFAEHTDEDLGEALAMLTKRGMKRLVLDLRSNPGGQLDQPRWNPPCTNRFVPKGSDGRLHPWPRARTPIRLSRQARRDRLRWCMPDDHAGEPQHARAPRKSSPARCSDYDRALMMGETHLRQGARCRSVYRVSGGAGLALTTARYYTPSGRLIQRPWDGTFDEYLTYTMKDQETRTHSEDQLKYTTGGRKVYSGGGIEPDERFDGPLEGFSPSRFSRSLYNRGLFASYAEQFYGETDDRPGTKAASFKYVKKGFEVDAAMVEAFKAFVVGRNTKMDEGAWSKDLEFIKAMIRFEIDQAVFDIATARQRLITADPQARFALSRFPEAERLAELSRNRPARVGQ